jgi:type I restriction enzyme S subunit
MSRLTNWDIVPIGSIFRLKQGTYLADNEMSDIETETYAFPVYGANGIIGYSKEKMYEERTSLVSCRGANCGVIHFTVPNSWVSNNSIACIPNVAIDPTFYHYVFLNTSFTDVITGSAQPQITITSLSTKRLVHPPLGIQHRIADILSAYDDLIENNRRRMELLEETARQLYREWFVRLRFPGREHTRVINGVPEGWERKTLADLCESIDYGYTASAEKKEVGPKFLRITDIVPTFIDWSSVPYCQIEDDRLSKFRLSEGDIVIARTGATVGYAKRLHKRHADAVFASYLVRLRLKPDMDNLVVGVFVESEDYKDYVKSRVGGAAQPNANAKVLAGAEILVPPSTLQRAFREFVEPLVDQREVLQVQNEKLRAARDLLLPRLMSGEISV